MLNSTGIEYLFEHQIAYYDFGPPLYDSGKSLYFQSQIHGNETFSTLVLINLINRLNKYEKGDILGTIRLVPRINPLSWYGYLYKKEGRYDNDSGTDWNRIFQWDILNSVELNDKSYIPVVKSIISDKMSEGIIISEALSLLICKLSLGYDVKIDVHTPENGIEHIYCRAYNESSPNFGIKHIIEFHEPKLHTFDEENERRFGSGDGRLSALTIELPSNIPATKAHVDAWGERFENELVRLGFLKGMGLGTQLNNEVIIGQMKDYIPRTSGIICYNCNLGSVVEASEVIAEVIDYNLFNSEALIASKDCIPLCFKKGSMVSAGNWAIRVLEGEHNVAIN